MTQYFIGIDPGLTGGVAVLDPDGLIRTVARFNGRSVCEVLDEVMIDLGGAEASVAMERVHARPGQGVTSMFTFGVGYGQIQGWLAARCIDFELYTPQAWQKILPISCSPKERVKKWALKKHTALSFIFAGCRIMHQGCLDAAAIAEYHRCIELKLIAIPHVGVKRKKKAELKF